MMKIGEGKVAGKLLTDIISVLQLMIRVVNAFRHGVDGQQIQQATSNPNIQRVLQKQASLNKRLSAASALSDPPQNCHVIQQLSTKSHTETAV